MIVRERHLTLSEDMSEPDNQAVLGTRTTAEGYNFDVSTVDSRTTESGETIVQMLAWSGYTARPDEIDRSRILADTLRAHLVSIDHLGVGDGTSQIPTYLRPEIQHGNFGSVSRLQWDVLRQEGSVPSLGSLSVLGYSLGAAMAASFVATAPEGTKIDRLFMWETVGVRRQPVAALVAKFGVEALKWNRYFPENPEWMHQPGNDPTMLLRMKNGPAGYVDYPRGLAHGTVLADMIQAREREIIDGQTEIILMSNMKSRVSSLADNGCLAENLINNGMKPKVWDQYLGESHGMIDSTMRLKSAIVDYR